MLKEGQHKRIVNMAHKIGSDLVRYDRELERYTLTPDQYERLLMLAAMGGNPFEEKK